MLRAAICRRALRLSLLVPSDHVVVAPRRAGVSGCAHDMFSRAGGRRGRRPRRSNGFSIRTSSYARAPMTRVVIDNGGTDWLTPLATLLAVVVGGLVNWVA